MKQVNQSVLKQDVTTNKHLAAVIAICINHIQVILLMVVQQAASHQPQRAHQAVVIAEVPAAVAKRQELQVVPAAVIRQRVILLAIRAIHMLLMIADMILSMMMEIMTGTDIRKIRTMLMV